MTKSSNSFAFLIFLFACIDITSADGQSIRDLRDLQDLRDRYEAGLLTGPSNRTRVQDIASDRPVIAKLPIVISDSLSADRTSAYFGYDYFLRSEGLQIWDNLPPTQDYRIGPGDEIIISLWGQSEQRTAHIVNRDGNIFIEKIGLLNLNGRSFEDVQQYIRRKFEKVFATLKGSKAETFIDVSLGNLKTINIIFIGEVNLPAIRPVHPFSSVTTALIQAGGVKTTGSLRDIQVIRNEEVVSRFDLYEFLSSGKSLHDMQLRDRDVIFVPIRNSTIDVKGAVHRPAIYEARTGESVFDIISFSGLPTAQASNILELNRIVPRDMRTDEDNVTENVYTTLSSASSIRVRDGDIITIRDILPQINQVYIYGQVKYPGEYAYQDSLSLMDLLRLAGGIDDTNFWHTVYKDQAEIIRRDPGSDYPKVIKVNLRALKAGDETQNVLLKNWDQVIIRENPKYDPPQNVTVLGEVNVPGVYTINRDGETLENLFARVGGFDAEAFEAGIRMYRDNQRVILSDYSISIQDGDSIFVPERPGVVVVIGEVYTPGLIHYSDKLKLKDYIENAGGFNLNADRKNISVEYANGDVKIPKFWGSPKIEEGVIIRVHTEEEREPLNTTQFLAEMASIIASMATIFFIVSQQP